MLSSQVAHQTPPSLYHCSPHQIERAMRDAQKIARKAARRGRFAKPRLLRQALRIQDACAELLEAHFYAEPREAA
jgi:hypothetical protein